MISNINWFFNNKINGTKNNTILLCENDDILVPFKHETKFVKDINPKSNLDYYINNAKEFNIVIDNRLILTISYLAFYIDDLLIYDTACNYVVSFNKFVNKLLFNDHERIFDRLKITNLLFTYSFIKYRCYDLCLNWKIEIGLNTINNFNYLPHSYNIDYLLYYIQSVNPDIELIRNYKPKNISELFKINDNLTKLGLKNKNELLMELFTIKQFKSNYLLLC
jgi:hypothetical protein